MRVLDLVGRRPGTPIVFCIDVEPDPRVFDRADPDSFAGFERLVGRLPQLRERLSEATGKPAAFTWFLRMDPQVAETWGSPAWIADSHGAVLAELTERGDELGLHTHTWRRDDGTGEWFADYEDRSWAEHCLTMGLDAFETAFGRRCRAHRGGDRFLDGVMIPVLEAHGVRVDLTVEPGLSPLGALEGEAARGLSPDYRGVPSRPYRSSADTFPAPDPTPGSDLLFVPLVSSPRMRPPFGRFPLYLNHEHFQRRVALELFRRIPTVALAVRSSSALSSDAWTMISERLTEIARYRRMEFVAASEAAHRYERAGIA
jgi:peptidoglycan/xylan/chitin deacetylase (PgdA/CDA1 family)